MVLIFSQSNFAQFSQVDLYKYICHKDLSGEHFGNFQTQSETHIQKPATLGPGYKQTLKTKNSVR